jgi:hypothetical protein
MKLKVKSVAAAGVIAAGALVGMSGSAQAFSGTWTVYNDLTHTCLDSNQYGHVYHIGCNGGQYQRWNINTVSGDTVYLQDVATGLCLWAGDSLTYNPIAYTKGCNLSNGYDLWYRTASGGSFFYNYAYDACLDAGQGGLVYHGAGGCYGNEYQRWYLFS